MLATQGFTRRLDARNCEELRKWGLILGAVGLMIVIWCRKSALVRRTCVIGWNRAKRLSCPEIAGDEPIDMRSWKSEQGQGEIVGPQVRAAGRVIFQRPTGKLIFVNIRDWTGDIQLFIGKKQVGEESFELAKQIDLGDLVGVDGWLGRTNTGELTIFAEQLHFLCKSFEPPPEKHHGLTDPELRQRMRYLDLTYTRGRAAAFPRPHEDRPFDSPDVGQLGILSRSRVRPCTRLPAAPPRGLSSRTTTRWT